MNLSKKIKEICIATLYQTFPEAKESVHADLIEITEATQEKFGHYQCNAAMKLTKILGQNPRMIAEKWVHTLEENSLKETPSLIFERIFSKIEIAGPGFINFTLDNGFLSQLTQQQLNDPYLGIEKPEKPLKIVIDFSSPNIAKEMHVGHLRSTIIGDSLARVFRFLGHEVLPLNHVGDWGTQFGMLIAHLKTVLPTITEEKTPPNVTLKDLVQWYKDAKKRFDEEPEFKKQSQLEVVKLQGGDETSKLIWDHICEISRNAYEVIYDLLDIHLIERGESYYNLHLPELIKNLESNGFITISDGAKCLYLDGFTNRDGDPLPLILQKSDGGFNYATTDMAALKHRVQDEKADWIIYVTDAGQSLHFEMIFEAGKKTKIYDPAKVRIDHVPFGLVLRPDGKKFKTRSGDTERLIDLLETAIQKSKEALQSRQLDISEAELKEASEILGIDAVKYADLACHRLSDYIFSYDKMLRFEGNTAAFLLYAYVRIQSIKRKSSIKMEDLLNEINENHDKNNNLYNSGTGILLEEPAEIALALMLARFNDVIDDTIEELLPNRLTDYLYTLAEKFHVFFHQCRVEGSKEQKSRLLLIEVVSRVLSQGLQLLGLKTLEKM